MNSGKGESTKDNLKGVMTMSDNSMAFLEALGNSDVEDFFKSLAVRVLAQLMEIEVTNRLCASKHERADQRKVTAMVIESGLCIRA